jgi:hypothetical protein
MPDSLHPPYAAASTNQPRQLLRWLDINAQNGPLGKCQTFITLPIFGPINTNWKGYSEVVAAFNFEGPNAFALTGGNVTLVTGAININDWLTQIPNNPNYMLCIMFTTKLSSGVIQTTRYALWRGVGEVIYFNLPVYCGQYIKKNFRLEVWSTSESGIVSNTTPINFFTSKLQQIDYRYGNDAPLVVADPVITSFYGNLASVGDIPNTNLGTLARWTVRSGFDFINPGGPFIGWTDVANNPGYLFTGNPPVNNITTNLPGIPSGNLCCSMIGTTSYLSSPVNSMDVQCLILTARITGNQAPNSFIFSAYPSGLTLFWNNGIAGSNPVNLQGLNLNVWYTFILWVNGGQINLYVYNTATGAIVGSVNGVAPFLTATNEIILGNAGMDILECVVGSGFPRGNSDLQQIINYMYSTYFVAPSNSLPIVFPPNSAPVLN